MINLMNLTQPVWVSLGHGVRVRCHPFTSALMLAVRADYRREIGALPLGENPPAAEDLGLRFNMTVARRAIFDWEGVGGEDDKPLPCTQEGIEALMGLFQFLKAFELAYVNPRMELDAEKNGSSPVLNGTSSRAADQLTAEDAEAPAPSAPTH